MLNSFITYMSSRVGKTAAAILGVSLMLSIVATSANLLVDAGAAAHNVFCPDHGWVA